MYLLLKDLFLELRSSPSLHSLNMPPALGTALKNTGNCSKNDIVTEERSNGKSCTAIDPEPSLNKVTFYRR